MVTLYLYCAESIPRDMHTAIGRAVLFATPEMAPFENEAVLMGEYGKPYIPGAPHFSISHSNRCVACAVSREHTVGVDVEAIDSRHKRVASRFFTPAEAEYAAASFSGFAEIWTRKESYVKLLGTGFATSFRLFDTFAVSAVGNVFFHSFALGGVVGCVCAPDDASPQICVIDDADKMRLFSRR